MKFPLVNDTLFIYEFHRTTHPRTSVEFIDINSSIRCFYLLMMVVLMFLLFFAILCLFCLLFFEIIAEWMRNFVKLLYDLTPKIDKPRPKSSTTRISRIRKRRMCVLLKINACITIISTRESGFACKYTYAYLHMYEENNRN